MNLSTFNCFSVSLGRHRRSFCELFFQWTRFYRDTKNRRASVSACGALLMWSESRTFASSPRKSTHSQGNWVGFLAEFGRRPGRLSITVSFLHFEWFIFKQFSDLLSNIFRPQIFQILKRKISHKVLLASNSFFPDETKSTNKLFGRFSNGPRNYYYQYFNNFIKVYFKKRLFRLLSFCFKQMPSKVFPNSSIF